MARPSGLRALPTLLVALALAAYFSGAPAGVHAAIPEQANAPTPAGAAAAIADDHAHDHAAEEAALKAAAAAAAPAAAAAKTGAADPHDHAAEKLTTAAADPHAGEEHAHDEEEHAAEKAAATTAAVDEHAGETAEEHAAHAHEEGDSHAGHGHGLSFAGYCEAVMAGEDPCAYVALTNYNLGLHIGSIFILLGVSAAGALLPVILHISSRSSLVLAAVKMGTYFGFGTILSTAFIHMLLPAQMNLSSPCLPESWTGAYEAWAYLFVVLAIVAMQLIDYLIEGQYQRYLERRGGAQPHSQACHEQAGCGDEHTHHAAVVGAMMSLHSSKAHLGTTCTHAHDLDHSHRHDAERGMASAPPVDSTEAASEDSGPCAVHGPGCETLIKHQHRVDPSQVVGIYMMEAGIIFHSVLIGITLGVTAGEAFNTLLIALSFHQFFEGFAIGSAVVDSGMGAVKSMLMGLAYSVTTPIGIAVGIGVRESFNSNADTTLMVEGIFDSISTGILIYVVLVELINPLMTQSAWLRSRRWYVQAGAFLSFYSGITVMAVLGKWA